MMISETIKQILITISKSPSTIDKLELLKELKKIEGFEKYHEWINTLIESHEYLLKHSGGICGVF